IAKMQEIIKALTQEVQELNKEKETKQPELNERWKEKCLDAYVKLRVAEITASKDADKQDTDIAARQLEQMIANAHEVGVKAMDHVQAQELAAAQVQTPQSEPEPQNAQ